MTGHESCAYPLLQDWQIKAPWFELPPPIAWRADPATCSHAVLDECVGAYWGYEDCVTCGQRFPMRGEDL